MHPIVVVVVDVLFLIALHPKIHGLCCNMQEHERNFSCPPENTFKDTFYDEKAVRNG